MKRGTGSQSPHRRLYGSGQIIALCGLRFATGREQNSGGQIGERERETERGKGERKREWFENAGAGMGEARLKFHTHSNPEGAFCNRDSFTSRLFTQMCAAQIKTSEF